MFISEARRQHEAIQTIFCYAAENCIFTSRIFFHHIRVLCQGHFVISIVSDEIPLRIKRLPAHGSRNDVTTEHPSQKYFFLFVQENILFSGTNDFFQVKRYLQCHDDCHCQDIHK